jgi:hypothetical protein
MTPRRDEDANSGDFAPVIPLRRRQPGTDTAVAIENPEPDARGIWDPDAPIADLTERPPPRNKPTPTDLLARPTASADEADTPGDETTAAVPRGKSPRNARRRLAQLTAALAVLATAAVIVALAGGAHPRATHAATITPTRVSEPTVTATAAAKTVPKTNTHLVGVRAADRPRSVARHGRKRPAHHAAVTASAYRPRFVVATSLPATQEPARTTPVARAQDPVRSPRTISGKRSSGITSCVPGELGC